MNGPEMKIKKIKKIKKIEGNLWCLVNKKS